ncbi:hypothetical protein ACUXK4_004893 [Methylorubrum extorquens]
MTESQMKPASPRALSLAAAGFGNVLANFLIYHSIQYRQKQEDALNQAMDLLRGAAAMDGIMKDDAEVVAEARRVIEDILDQVEAHARGHMKLERPQGGKPIN